MTYSTNINEYPAQNMKFTLGMKVKGEQEEELGRE